MVDSVDSLVTLARTRAVIKPRFNSWNVVAQRRWRHRTYFVIGKQKHQTPKRIGKLSVRESAWFVITRMTHRGTPTVSILARTLSNIARLVVDQLSQQVCRLQVGRTCTTVAQGVESADPFCEGHSAIDSHESAFLTRRRRVRCHFLVPFTWTTIVRNGR